MSNFALNFNMFCDMIDQIKDPQNTNYLANFQLFIQKKRIFSHIFHQNIKTWA